MRNISMKEFLSSVLPTHKENSFYCLGKMGLDSSKMEEEYVNTIDELVDKASDYSEQDFNIYFSVGRLSKDKRKQDNCTAIKCLFMDIDVGKKNTTICYKNSADARQSISDFLSEVGSDKFKNPIWVSSGNGYHLYWPLKEEVDTEEWGKLAKDFKDFVEDSELKVDSASMTNSVAYLRMPDTKNLKANKKARVISEQLPTPETFKYYRKLIPTKKEPTKKEVEQNDEFNEVISNSKFSFQQIIDRSLDGNGCNQILELYNNQKEQTEPAWRAALSIIKFCEDKDDWMHKFSENYDGYNKLETEKKLGRTLKPYLCATFESHSGRPDLCKSCVNRKDLKSPISLGRLHPLKSISMDKTDKSFTEIVSQTLSSTQVQVYKEEPPEFPDDPIFKQYYQTDDGAIWRRGIKKAVDIPISEDPIWLSRRLIDRKEGHMVELKYILPRDGIKTFLVPAWKLSSQVELQKVLGFEVGFASQYMKDVMIFLQNSMSYLKKVRPAEETYPNFGWTEEIYSNKPLKFVLGDRLITPTDVLETPKSPITILHRDRFTNTGSLEKWTYAINKLYQPEGEELRRFVLGLGLASPLVAFSNIEGALINLRSDSSGYNKTSTLIAINSIYGHATKLMMKGKDTVNSMWQRRAEYNSVPLTIDEFTNLKKEDASRVAFGMSEGEAPNRLQGSENKERDNYIRWKGMTIIASNTDFIQLIKAHSKNSAPELARILQFDLENFPTSLEDGETQDLVKILLLNHGQACTPFIQYVMTNKSLVQQELDALTRKVRAEGNLTKQGRYWASICAMGFLGVRYGNQLKLWDFDYNKTYQCVMEILDSTKAETVSVGDNDKQILAEYLNYRAGYTLVINNTIDNRVNNTVGQEEREDLVNQAILLPKFSTTYVRQEPDTRLIYINRKDFVNYLEGRVSAKAMLARLKETGLVLADQCSKKMNKGTAIASNSVNTIMFDMDKVLGKDAPVKDSDK